MQAPGHEMRFSVSHENVFEAVSLCYKKLIQKQPAIRFDERIHGEKAPEPVLKLRIVFLIRSNAHNRISAGAGVF